MRLIDADALIEFVEGRYTVTWNHDYDGGIKDACIDILNFIDNAPTIDAVPHWIPCEEGLPNDRSWYLGIFREVDTGWINPIPFICDYIGHDTGITTVDYWILKDHKDDGEFGFEYYRNMECVAWMPLPGPYKEEVEK